MMGRSHTLSGLVAGCCLAGCVPSAPAPVQLLAVAATGGAALLPDLDHPSSTVARSLGIVTRLLARAIDRVSLATYYATREERDPGERRSGHRLLTHTVPGCLLAASLVAALCLLHPVGGGIAVSLLVGLLGLGLRKLGGGVALTAGGAAWWTLEHHSPWWWLFPTATLVGCLAHILGDACTTAGVPLWWPLLRDGRRWRPVTTPVTFSAGDPVERAVVTPLLVGCLVAASLWPLGGWRALISLVVSGGA